MSVIATMPRLNRANCWSLPVAMAAPIARAKLRPANSPAENLPKRRRADGPAFVLPGAQRNPVRARRADVSGEAQYHHHHHGHRADAERSEPFVRGLCGVLETFRWATF